MKQEMMVNQWHQLDYMEIICTSLRIMPVPHHSSFFSGQMLFLMPNQQCQSSECKIIIHSTVSKRVPTFKLSVALSNLNQFSEFLHCWRAYKI